MRRILSVYFETLGCEEGDYFFPGETRELIFDKPGTYPYICEPHHDTHNMKGTIHAVE